MSGETTVMLVEDDAIVRDWVTLCLEGTDLRLVGRAGGVAEAEDLVARRMPAVLLVDYQLGDGTAIDLIRRLRYEGWSTPAIVFTAIPRRGLNEAAHAAGAQGTVLKAADATALLDALRAAAAGVESFDPRHPPRHPGETALSPREREVLRWIAQGQTNRQVAAELGVSEQTVKTLVNRAFAKLGAHRRAEAVAAAQLRGAL